MSLTEHVAKQRLKRKYEGTPSEFLIESPAFITAEVREVRLILADFLVASGGDPRSLYLAAIEATVKT